MCLILCASGAYCYLNLSDVYTCLAILIRSVLVIHTTGFLIRTSESVLQVEKH